ncbi:MAG: ABC transporter substrate-binding protein, partial [Sphaerochaetaceae bacterium]
MNKKWFIFVLVLCLSLTTVWATGSAETQTSDGPVKEISIFHFKSLWLEPWEELMGIYEDETGIKVNSEITGGSSDYSTMLKTKVAAGEVADIFFIHGYTEYKLFEEYIEPQNDAGWIAHVAEFAKDGYTVDGKVIGMPMTVETFGLIYNKDIFAQAGIVNPPKTYEELVDAVAKLNAIGVTPFSTGAATAWVIGHHFANVAMSKRSHMPEYIAALNNGTATIAEDPLMKEWQNVFDLIFSNCAPNPLSEDHQTEVTLFAQGKVAMMLQGNWKENSVLTINPDMNMGLLPIPLGPNDELDGYVLSGLPFFVSINAKASDGVKQACKDFC